MDDDCEKSFPWVLEEKKKWEEESWNLFSFFRKSRRVNEKKSSRAFPPKQLLVKEASPNFQLVVRSKQFSAVKNAASFPEEKRKCYHCERRKVLTCFYCLSFSSTWSNWFNSATCSSDFENQKFLLFGDISYILEGRKRFHNASRGIFFLQTLRNFTSQRKQIQQMKNLRWKNNFIWRFAFDGK